MRIWKWPDIKKKVVVVFFFVTVTSLLWIRTKSEEDNNVNQLENTDEESGVEGVDSVMEVSERYSRAEISDEISVHNYKIYPEADVYVRAGQFSSDNFADDSRLRVEFDHYGYEHREAYLRFDLKDVMGPISFVQLALSISRIDSSKRALKCNISEVEDVSWDEEEMNWNNRPNISTYLTTFSIRPNQDNAYIDLSPFFSILKPHKKISLLLSSTEIHEISIKSKESGVNTSPYLDISVISTSTPSPQQHDEALKSIAENALFIIVLVSVGLLCVTIASVTACCIVFKRRQHQQHQQQQEVSLPTPSLTPSPPGTPRQLLLPDTPRADDEKNCSNIKPPTPRPVKGKAPQGRTGAQGTLRHSWDIEYDEVKLERELGSGSFGVVYKAAWRAQEVAVKKIVGAKVSDEQLQAFKHEIKLMKGLRPHKHVIQMLGAITDPNNICIILEYCCNGSLHQIIHSKSQMGSAFQLKLIKGIVSGMLHLHKEGVVHRDLAARNILLNESFDAKVSDFGLSRTILQSQPASSKTLSPLGPLKVWSFGVVVWEIMARAEPFAGMDAIQAAFSVRDGKRLEIPKDCPDALAEIMKRSWCVDPETRPEFKDILAVVQILEENTKGSSSTIYVNGRVLSE